MTDHLSQETSNRSYLRVSVTLDKFQDDLTHRFGTRQLTILTPKQIEEGTDLVRHPTPRPKEGVDLVLQSFFLHANH